jgi:hypothetical protein
VAICLIFSTQPQKHHCNMNWVHSLAWKSEKENLYSTNSTTIQRHFDHGISNSPHSLPTNHHKHPPSLQLAILLTSNFTTQNCMRIFLENLRQVNLIIYINI